MHGLVHNKILNGIFLVIRLALGLIFCYSAAQKILHPADFLGSVYDFDLTGPRLSLLVAVVMPWLELVLSLALLSGWGMGGALCGSVLLFALFLGVQLSAVWRGISVSCGCFGPEKESMVGVVTLARTMLLLLAAALAFGWHGYLQSRTGRTMPQAGDSSLPPSSLKPVAQG